MAALGEQAPLLAASDHDGLERSTSKDGVGQPEIVDFDPNGDPENPLDWPRAYKWGIVALLAMMAFTTTFTCIGVVPVANRIVLDLNKDHHTDKSASVLLVTIWELGEAAGPLFIGPLSELFGRYRTINVANVLFIGATVLAALSPSTNLFIAARWLTGAAVSVNVLNPAIIGDIYQPEERGSPMSLVILAPLIGGAIGPAVAGGIAENLGWKGILWMSVALMTACELIFLCCFGETYKVTILRRRAAKLRNELGNSSIRTIFDVEDGKQGGPGSFWISITRPFAVTSGSGVLQIVALYGALSFTYYYIITTTLPDILDNLYGLSPAEIGLCFISFSAGSVVSVIACNILLDKIYIRLRDRNGGIGSPEYRLPLVMVGATTMPITVAMVGWAAQYRAPLPVLLLCVAFLGATMLLGYLPVTSYIVDALGLYSASGMTAAIVVRCTVSTFFPLTTQPLIARFGYGWAFTVLAFVALTLAPIPMLLYRYGMKWRQSSPYTRQT